MKNNKVALVTGGSRGIGKAIAKEFASKGYDLVINYVSNNIDLLKLEKEIKGEKEIEVFFIKTDITSFKETEDMVKKAIERFQKIDVLINNAGVTKDNLILRMKEEEFDKVINVNLKGLFNVTKNMVPYMIKQKDGKIVNISSVVGIIGNAGQTNYTASKAGVIGFSKSLAKELASRNILVNVVAPGFIKTDMTDILKQDKKDNINNQIPLKKMGNPAEVAKAVYFLASEENTYITGQVLNVDGGMVM